MICRDCQGTGIDDPRTDTDCGECDGTGRAPILDGPEDYACDRERDAQIGVC